MVLLSASDFWDIGSGWKADIELRGPAILPVVLQKALANIARGHANNGVFTRVIGRRSPKQFDADDPFLECSEASREGLLDNVDKELSAAVTSSEGFAFYDLPKIPEKLCTIFL